MSRAIALRDLAAGDLDDTAREIQARIYGRSAHAKSQSPAIDLFPGGLGGYTDATIDERSPAFRLLLRRVGDHLPVTDPVRTEFAPVLARQLDAWDAALDAVTTANVELEVRRSARDRALTAWDQAMIQVYGTLVAELGKKKADRYFRKGSRHTTARPAATAPVAVDPMQPAPTDPGYAPIAEAK
ncbi:MAG: hypothetical protein ABMB14_39345 [Myxococcota bacterium]